jgi:micrococcal nuclease
MSKHWRQDNSRGRRGGQWLSPAAYDALSPAEKRALWGERQIARHNTRFRPTPARYRKGYYARQRLIWLAGSMLVCAAITKFGLPLLPDPSPAVIEQSAMPSAGRAPAAAADAADAADTAWQRRGRADDRPSTLRQSSGQAGSGRTATGAAHSFGLCKWGGGTNCVVDGDTFYIGGAKVRIAGIDAPETHDYGCGSELALGDRATAELQALLNSGAVTMTSIDRDRDRYGRLLRNVQVDGADVGETMVGDGVAREYGGGRRPWC